MHAFDFIVLFFSFVYAAAITHVLATTGEIIIEAKRIRLSWLNAGWMLVSLLATCAWWIGLWDLREVKVWTIGLIAFFFLMASALYLLARMVSPRIAHDGEIDLVTFHSQEGRKYIAAFAGIAAVTVLTNSVIGQAAGAAQWPAQNYAVGPMALAAVAAATFIRNIRIQIAALVVELAAWAVYFAFLQSSLNA